MVAIIYGTKRVFARASQGVIICVPYGNDRKYTIRLS